MSCSIFLRNAIDTLFLGFYPCKNTLFLRDKQAKTILFLRFGTSKTTLFLKLGQQPSCLGKQQPSCLGKDKKVLLHPVIGLAEWLAVAVAPYTIRLADAASDDHVDLYFTG